MATAIPDADLFAAAQEGRRAAANAPRLPQGQTFQRPAGYGIPMDAISYARRGPEASPELFTPRPPERSGLGNAQLGFRAGAVSGAGSFFNALEGLSDIVANTIADTLGADDSWAGDAFGFLEDYLDKRADELRGRQTADFREAVEKFTVEGSLTDPSTWKVGDEASLVGLFGVTVEGLGSIAPVVLGGWLGAGVRGTAMAAGVGAGMAAGDQMQVVDDYLTELAETGRISEEVPYYNDLLNEGVSPSEALGKTRDLSRTLVGLTAGLVGGAGGAATNAIARGKSVLPKLAANIQGNAQRAANSQSGLVRRMATGALVGAVEEGAQEAAETASNPAVTNLFLGTDRDVMEGTLGDALIGALVGAPVGAIGGALNQGERVDEDIEAGLTPGNEAPDALPAPEQRLMLPPPPPKQLPAPPRERTAADTPEVVVTPPPPEAESVPAEEYGVEDTPAPEALPTVQEQYPDLAFDDDGNVVPVRTEAEPIEDESLLVGEIPTRVPAQREQRRRVAKQVLGEQTTSSLSQLFSPDGAELKRFGKKSPMEVRQLFNQLIDNASNFMVARGNYASRAMPPRGVPTTRLRNMANRFVDQSVELRQLAQKVNEIITSSDVLNRETALDIATALMTLRGLPRGEKFMRALQSRTPDALYRYMLETNEILKREVQKVRSTDPTLLELPEPGQIERAPVSKGEQLRRVVAKENRASRAEPVPSMDRAGEPGPLLDADKFQGYTLESLQETFDADRGETGVTVDLSRQNDAEAVVKRQNAINRALRQIERSEYGNDILAEELERAEADPALDPRNPDDVLKVLQKAAQKSRQGTKPKSYTQGFELSRSSKRSRRIFDKATGKYRLMTAAERREEARQFQEMEKASGIERGSALIAQGAKQLRDEAVEADKRRYKKQKSESEGEGEGEGELDPGGEGELDPAAEEAEKEAQAEGETFEAALEEGADLEDEGKGEGKGEGKDEGKGKGKKRGAKKASGVKKSEERRWKLPTFRRLRKIARDYRANALRSADKPGAFTRSVAAANNARSGTYTPKKAITVRIPAKFETPKGEMTREEVFGIDQEYVVMPGAIPKRRFPNSGDFSRFAPKKDSKGRLYYELDQVQVDRVIMRGSAYRQGVKVREDFVEFRKNATFFDPLDIDSVASALIEEGVLQPGDYGRARAVAEYLIALAYDYQAGKAPGGRSKNRGDKTAPVTPSKPVEPVESVEPEEPVEAPEEPVEAPEDIDELDLSWMLSNQDGESAPSQIQQLKQDIANIRDTIEHLQAKPFRREYMEAVDQVEIDPNGEGEGMPGVIMSMPDATTREYKTPGERLGPEFWVKAVEKDGKKLLVETTLVKGKPATRPFKEATYEADMREMLREAIDRKVTEFEEAIARKEKRIAELLEDSKQAGMRPAEKPAKPRPEVEEKNQEGAKEWADSPVVVYTDDDHVDMLGEAETAPSFAERKIIDRRPLPTEPETPPTFTYALDDKALDEVGMEGAAAIANAYDKRRQVLSQFGPQDSGHAGFLLMDGPGTGKTRQMLAAAVHMLETRAAGDDRKVLIVVPGSGEFEASRIQKQWAGDLEAILTPEMQKKYLAPRPFSTSQIKFNTKHFDVRSHAGLGNKGASANYLAVMVDEAHDNFIGEGKSKTFYNNLEKVKADFRVLATATMANSAGQETYALRLIAGTAGTPLKEVERDVRAVVQTKDPKRHAEGLDRLLDQGARNGQVVSRQLVPLQKSFVKLVDHRPEHKILFDVLNKESIDATVRSVIMEYLKLPATLSQTLSDLAADPQNPRQVIVAFEMANPPKALSEPTKDEVYSRYPWLWEAIKEDPEVEKLLTQAPVDIFFDRLTKVEGGKYSQIFGKLAGRSNNAKEELQLIDDFQAGKKRVMSITVGKAGTGLSLDDQSKDGKLRPRHLIIANMPESSTLLEQLLGRHDRRATKSIPYTTYLRMKDLYADARLMKSLKERMNYLDHMTGRDAFYRDRPNARPKLVHNLEDFKRQSPATQERANQADGVVVQAMQGGVGLRELMEKAAGATDRRTRRAIRRLLTQSGLDEVQVRSFKESGLGREALLDENGVPLQGLLRFDGGTPTVYINETGPVPTQTLMHEYVHALTAAKLANERNVRGQVMALMSEAPQSLRESFPEAFRNPDEFVAEAFSNIVFQDAMRAAEGRSRRTVWQRFIDFVARLLGVTPSLPRGTLEELAAITRLETDSLKGYTSREAYQYLPEPLARRNATLKMPERLWEAAEGQARTRATREKLYIGRLALQTFDQTVKLAASMFGEVNSQSNPLENLLRVTERRQARKNKLHQEYERKVLDPYKAYAHNRKKGGRIMRNVPLGPNGKRVDMEESLVLAHLINSSGYAGVDYSKPETDSANHRLGRGKNKDGTPRKGNVKSQALWRQQKPIYDALSADAKKVYTTLRDQFAERYGEASRRVVGAQLDQIDPLDSGSWVDRTTKQQSARVSELREMSADDLKDMYTSKDELKNLRDLLKPGYVPGAYFPLRRFGEYVVTIKETASFAAQEDAEAWAAQHPGASVKQNSETGEYDAKLRVVSRFETRVQAANFRKAAQQDFPNAKVSNVELLSELIGKRHLEGGNFELVRRTEERLLKRNPDMTKAQIDAIIRPLALTLIDLSPESSITAALLSRAGVLGASLDIERILTNYGHQWSNYASALEFSKQVRDSQVALRSAANDIQRNSTEDDDRQWKAPRVADSLINKQNRTDDMMQLNSFFQGLTDLGFFYYLVGVSYNLVNATQPMMVALPHLGARHGNLKATAAFKRAYARTSGPVIGKLAKTGFTATELKRLWRRGEFFDKSSYDIVEDIIGKQPENSHHRRLLDYLVENGYVDVSLAQDMARMGAVPTVDENGNKQPQSWHNFLTEWMRMAPHLIEVMNRSVTGMAAFDLEYEKAKGEGLSDAAAFARARDYSVRAIKDTMFIYANWNKPLVLQSQTARVALMFMQHVQHMYFFMLSRMVASVKGASLEERKEARKALANFVGMHIAVAGVAGGTPELIKWLLGVTEWAAEQLGIDDDEDDEPWDLRVHNVMADWLGPELGSIAAGGLPRAVGLDLGDRVGIDSMLVFGNQGPPGTREEFAYQAFTLAAGPIGGLAMRGFDATQYISNGQPIRAVESTMPKVIRDPMMSIRIAGEGFTDRSGKVYANSDELTYADYVAKALGFRPTNEQDIQTRRAFTFEFRRRMERRNRQLDRLYLMRKQGEGMAQIMATAREWNRTHPDTPPLTYKSIRTSFERRNKIERETRRGLYAPSSQRRYFDQLTRNME